MVGGSRGFTFGEVMLALSILTAVGFGLDRPQRLEANAVRASFRQLQARTLAEDHLESLRENTVLPKPGAIQIKTQSVGFRTSRHVKVVAPGLVEVRMRVEHAEIRPLVLTTRIAGKEGS